MRLVSLYFQVGKLTIYKELALWRATRKILSSSKALGVPMYQIHSLAVFAGRIFKSSQSGETMPSAGEYHSEREKRSIRQSWEVHVKKYNVCLKKKDIKIKKKTPQKGFSQISTKLKRSLNRK